MSSRNAADFLYHRPFRVVLVRDTLRAWVGFYLRELAQSFPQADREHPAAPGECRSGTDVPAAMIPVGLH